MENLIEAVRAEPSLWNPLHPDYREQAIKDEAWHRVIEHYNEATNSRVQKPIIMTIQAAKTEWKRLRDNHRDALKRAKLGKNKLLPAQITTWKYAKAMQFLEPHMKYRITENIEMDPLTEPLKTCDHDVTTTDTPETSSYVPKRFKREYTNSERINENCERTVEVKPRNDSDALESFFHCILQSTREMPQWMQTQVKKKIFTVIIEAEEYLSQDQNSRNYERSNICNEGNVVLDKQIKFETFSEEED